MPSTHCERDHLIIAVAAVASAAEGPGGDLRRAEKMHIRPALTTGCISEGGHRIDLVAGTCSRCADTPSSTQEALRSSVQVAGATAAKLRRFAQGAAGESKIE